jgi:protein-S-isoprenylcysteine O-methyltransferase Ste14
MNPSIFIWLVYALWIILVLYLIVSAVGVKRDVHDNLLPSIILALAIIAAFLLPHLPLFDFVNFAPVNQTLSVIGISICIAGMIFFFWARQTLGKNWSKTVTIKEGHELVTSGPYRLVRHPIYTGGLIAAIGSAIVAGGAWVFLLIILGSLFIWRVGAEDKLMAQQFPNEYPEYKKRTKALIPFLF